MNPNHVYAKKAARAIALANAESNKPPRKVRVKNRPHTSTSESSWGTTTTEYLGDGFLVRGRGMPTRPNGRMPKSA